LTRHIQVKSGILDFEKHKRHHLKFYDLFLSNLRWKVTVSLCLQYI